MNSSVTKTLLALRELTVPLSLDEQALLQDIGQQLALDPDYWNFIKEELIAMIQANCA